MTKPYLEFDQAPAPRGEWLIAAGRIVLAALSLLALWLDPSSPARFARLTFLVLAGYLAYSVLLAALFARRLRFLLPSVAIGTQIVDVTLFAVLMYLSTGSSSPFFVFFTFAMVAATLRWQARGVMWTTMVALSAMLVLALYQTGTNDPEFELNRTIVRAAYLVVIAVGLGHLGAFEQRRRREIAALAAWPKPTTNELVPLLKANLDHATSMLGVRRALLIWEDPEEPWLEIAEWTGSELRRSRESPFAFIPRVADEVLGASFHVTDAASPNSLVVCKGPTGLTEWRGAPIHEGLVARFGLGHLLCFPLTGELVTGELILEGTTSTTPDDLALGSVVALRVANALDLYLLNLHLCEIAVVEERQRLSHELHDGILQSLAGIGLQLRRAEVLVTTEPSAVAVTLQDAQQLIEEEQRDIRFFVQGLRHFASAGADRELEARMAELVERVESVWGVKVTTAVDLEDATLSKTQEHAVFRIAQEAVVNAARHGGAKDVRVQISKKDHSLLLAVADNGHGFPFVGRYDDDALAEGHVGPVTLKARVKSVGGAMAIESGAQGARLEIMVPLKSNVEDLE